MRIFDKRLISIKTKVNKKFLKHFIYLFPDFSLKLTEGPIARYLSKRYNTETTFGTQAISASKNGLLYVYNGHYIQSYTSNRVYLGTCSLKHNGDYITKVKRKDRLKHISDFIEKSELDYKLFLSKTETSEILMDKISTELERLDTTDKILPCYNQYTNTVSFIGTISKDNIPEVLKDMTYISHILSDMNISLYLMFYTIIDDLICNVSPSEDMYLHDFNFVDLKFCLVLDTTEGQRCLYTYSGANLINYTIGKIDNYPFDNIKVRIYSRSSSSNYEVDNRLYDTKVFIPLDKVLSTNNTEVIHIKPTKINHQVSIYSNRDETIYNL